MFHLFMNYCGFLGRSGRDLFCRRVFRNDTPICCGRFLCLLRYGLMQRGIRPCTQNIIVGTSGEFCKLCKQTFPHITGIDTRIRIETASHGKCVHERPEGNIFKICAAQIIRILFRIPRLDRSIHEQRHRFFARRSLLQSSCLPDAAYSFGLLFDSGLLNACKADIGCSKFIIHATNQRIPIIRRKFLCGHKCTHERKVDFTGLHVRDLPFLSCGLKIGKDLVCGFCL